MQTPLSVSTLNNQIKSLLETHYSQISVIGEVSRVTYHSSGHLYFSLKDQSSSISCVMFKSHNQKLKFRVEEGMEVILHGSISLYSPRGTYQINATSLEPSGSGALALAYEQLKKELEQKGYFDKEIKKAIPKFPKKIAIITSKTGAAIEDMKRVAQKRWQLSTLVLFDTIVQGEVAANSIAQAIKEADTIGADVIVVGRGGGSLEDLWAFNERVVAEAIFKANTPIVSAVGHEIDTMISDFCADLRAPTPSAAMEMILPDINEILIYLDTLREQFGSTTKNLLSKKHRDLAHLKELFDQHSFERKLEHSFIEAKSLKERFESYIEIFLSQKKRTLDDLYRAYESNNPKNRDKIGIAQITKSGKKVDLESLKVDDLITLLNSKVKVEAKVLSKKEI
ncbi:MAG: exodeoxyribonuclease VII large subunit [Sulfurospirillum sp.]|nr:MAG: exodeoxyribonuclease VII large subunit [Sulfurospirillum sp.]